MTAPTVFVTRTIPETGLALLRQHCSVEVFPFDRLPTKQEIIEGVKGKDGLLCLLTDPIDAEVIAAEPKLRAIATYAVGYDNIDVAAATQRGILVSNTPGVLTDATAEMAWALLFCAARRITEGDSYTRAGRFTGWAPMLLLGQDVGGRTLGIVGAGRIGSAMALKSKGFGMTVLYYDAVDNPTLDKELGARRVPLDDLLRQADFVSLHVSLSKDTFHLIGEPQLRRMKKTAVLINTSRGPVVDEEALAKALKQGWIFSAGLDVYEREPAVSPELLKLPNVVLAPHIASATVQARSSMARIAAENLIASLQGTVPRYCVNPDAVGKRVTG